MKGSRFYIFILSIILVLTLPVHAEDTANLNNDIAALVVSGMTHEQIAESIHSSRPYASYSIDALTVMYLSLGLELVERGVYASPQITDSEMTYDELVALKAKINFALWNSQDWQEVTVPQGVWKVGEDIPAGTWTVKCADIGRASYMMKECHLAWGESLSADGQSVRWQGRYDLVTLYNPNHESNSPGQLSEYTFTVQDGDFIIIDSSYNQAVFMPYTGKPNLGFK